MESALYESSYMALQMLYKQSNIINKANNKCSEVESQTTYSGRLLSSIRSGWRWIFGGPSLPSISETPNEELSATSLDTILQLQKEIGHTLDRQMTSLIQLEDNTDRVIGKMGDNNNIIRNI